MNASQPANRNKNRAFNVDLLPPISPPPKIPEIPRRNIHLFLHPEMSAGLYRECLLDGEIERKSTDETGYVL
jgi:hypothetical protein